MVRLILRVLLTIIALLLFLLPFYISFVFKWHKLNGSILKFSYQVGCFLWGMHIRVKGKMSDKTPLLLVSNHFSYLDVFALGSVAAIRFTPKSEVAKWPVIGFFSKITGSIFIDRSKSQTLNNTKMMERMLHEGGAISLFPEGTTNDGTGILPFRSSLFSIARNSALTVQPVSIVYRALNGKPVTAQNRHIIGWYGDMGFFPHLGVYLQQKSITVEILFHETVQGSDFATRKELAKYCHDVIAPSIPAL